MYVLNIMQFAFRPLIPLSQLGRCRALTHQLLTLPPASVRLRQYSTLAQRAGPIDLRHHGRTVGASMSFALAVHDGGRASVRCLILMLSTGRPLCNNCRQLCDVSGCWRSERTLMKRVWIASNGQQRSGCCASRWHLRDVRTPVH